MKGLTRTIAASVLVVAGTLPAVAQDQGWYIGMGAGATFPNNSDVNGGGTSTDIDFDTGWTIAGTLGYAYGNGIRTEIELGYRENDIDQLSGLANGLGDSDAFNAMVNFLYDLRNQTDFTPYIGVGAGYLDLSLDNVTPIGGGVLDDSDGLFAYQGIAGVTYALNDQIGIFVDYRYVGTEEANMRTSTGINVDVDYDSHTVLAGLRFSLTPPAPPPPPEPAPAPAAAETPPPPTPPPAPEPEPIPGPYLVFFDWDKSDIRPDALAILEEAAANFQKFGIARIVVTGHADRSGPDAYNLNLSKRRADAVKATLLTLGVPDAQITGYWKGESEPLVPTEDGVREPQNRRVEIIYE
ncbi:MAG: OmpA family protein [Alphaproteobacteria bacterium]